MMRIDCPFCGPRPENEFHCGGQSHVQRPPLDCSDAVWGEYLFGRDNVKGVHAERWRHTYGCGRWFNVLRDTVTHEISAVYAMTEPRPDEPAPVSTKAPTHTAQGSAGRRAMRPAR